MSCIERLILIFLSILLLAILPARGQEPQKIETKKPWIGKLATGREITKQDLSEILKANDLWEDSQGKEGQLADLSNANLNGVKLGKVRVNFANLSRISLSNANLSQALLMYTDMSGANLSQADLSGTNFWDSDLSGANFNAANLSEARIIGGKMQGADFYWANLNKAYLRGTDLRGANLDSADLAGTTFWGVDLSRCNFEPKPGLTDITHWVSLKGLSSLTYKKSSHGLVELREIFKKAGMREQEREVTFALNHNRRLNLWKQGWIGGKLESLFHLMCFEWTCKYGMSPNRPLKIIGLGLFVFALPYMLALRSRKRKTGLWVLLMPDRVLDRRLKDRPYRLTTRTPFRSMASPWRVTRILRLGFYFSLLSAFSLGWRELNVGNWITRIQKREYTLRATGWVRSVGGLQSLLSVYMLALWVLTYFGRPFE